MLYVIKTTKNDKESVFSIKQKKKCIVSKRKYSKGELKKKIFFEENDDNNFVQSCLFLMGKIKGQIHLYTKSDFEKKFVKKGTLKKKNFYVVRSD